MPPPRPTPTCLPRHVALVPGLRLRLSVVCVCRCGTGRYKAMLEEFAKKIAPSTVTLYRLDWQPLPCKPKLRGQPANSSLSNGASVFQPGESNSNRKQDTTSQAIMRHSSKPGLLVLLDMNGTLVLRSTTGQHRTADMKVKKKR